MKDWGRFLKQISNSNLNQRIILLSSGGCVYTGDKLPFSEESEALGINRYGKFKLKQEKLLVEAMPKSIIVRLSNIYGLGQPHGRGQGVIAEWTHAIRNKLPLKIFGDPEASRDYLHIEDAVSAVLTLVESQESGCFNVGSGRSTTLNQIVKILTDLSGAKVATELHPGRLFDRQFYQLSIEKICEKTDWSPKISIEAGIARVFP